MELYIEYEFLYNFYGGFNDEYEQEIVKKIITDYGSKRVFIDFKTIDFEKLENENEYFALISNVIPPTPVDSIKNHLFLKSEFEQTIVFMNKEQDWFEDAENKGALCFSFDDYSERIKNIIDNLHFKIDLSEPFKDWNFLLNFKNLNFNHITIFDGYILTDRKNQKINKNIIPLLMNFLYLKNNKNNTIKILTRELIDRNKIFKENRDLSNNALIKKIEKLKKESASKMYTRLNSSFAKHNTKFSIVMNDLIRDTFDFHDRIILTNFSLLECGKGFNLIPHKKSNSRIVCETIFDKSSYNRLKNIQQMQEEYVELVKKSETNKFKMYPEIN